MRVTAHSHFADDPENLGWKERLQHLEYVKAGSPAYMVMCIAIDPLSSPREINEFIDKEIFVGGRLIENQSDHWLEILDRIPAHQLRS